MTLTPGEPEAILLDGVTADVYEQDAPEGLCAYSPGFTYMLFSVSLVAHH